MAREAVAAYFIVLVVVEHEGRYLLIHEASHGQTWYLPAGLVEPGETLIEAAVRETQEEAGVLVRPTALIALDHGWSGSGASISTRLRFALLATPVGSVAPKRVADEHSLESRWVTRAEIDALRLRGDDVTTFIDLVKSRSPMLPIDRYSSLRG
jgi:8-oxo-dGTP pyrophosphatase MutT (NUDIX family)